MASITTTTEEIQAAFTEWDRRYREDPAGFESDMERLLRGQTIEDYGEEVTPYFIMLLKGEGEETEAEAPQPPTKN